MTRLRSIPRQTCLAGYGEYLDAIAVPFGWRAAMLRFKRPANALDADEFQRQGNRFQSDIDIIETPEDTASAEWTQQVLDKYADKVAAYNTTVRRFLRLLDFQSIQDRPGEQPVPDSTTGGWFVEQVDRHHLAADRHGRADRSFHVIQFLPKFIQSLPMGLKSVGHRTGSGNSPQGVLLTSNFLPDFTLVGAMSPLFSDGSGY